MYKEIKTINEFEDPNEVKVVIDGANNALYFSREPIPSTKKWQSPESMYKQVCIMPFRRDYLLKFNNLPQTKLEKIESVDMLRVLENGERVKMVEFYQKSHSVDTESDLSKVIKLMDGDVLMRTYTNKRF